MDNQDNEKYLAQKQQSLYPKTFGRPDVRREPRRYFGWTLARWLLLCSNIVLLLYGMFFVLGCIVTYAKGYQRAIVIVVANRDILAVTFTAAFLAVITSIVGLVGIRWKDRRVLGIYALLLWPCFALLSAVGYLSYKGDVWNLRAKLGMQWRYDFSPQDQIALQDNLHCCGFDNPHDHATYFARCWPESLLPGCDYKFYLFEHYFLTKTYIVTFCLVPVHIMIIIISLLCANHVDHLFGTRPRPLIAYLGRFHDWRDWEQSRLKQVSLDDKKNYPLSHPNTPPEPIVTRARTTCTDHDQSMVITPRHSYEKN
ncbi:hypothetical protein BDA99DRAFT_443099 [Phascolomyces articulosus]|uniref:Tetraspanin Tsp2 n=1 Tax=Phascolomyces articulosus TaxID=60185 RepID=A0AAD5JTY3_9FUNG|nr:hypothetical protein BDA99DRAFT_443099 [Phascolomyces articulosus]